MQPNNDPRNAALKSQKQRDLILAKQEHERLQRHLLDMERQLQFAKTAQHGKGASELALAEAALGRDKVAYEDWKRRLEREKEEVIKLKRDLDAVRKEKAKAEDELSRALKETSSKSGEVGILRGKRLTDEKLILTLTHELETLDAELRKTSRVDDLEFKRITTKINEKQTERTDAERKLRDDTDEANRLSAEANAMRQKEHEIAQEVLKLQQEENRIHSERMAREAEVARLKQEESEKASMGMSKQREGDSLKQLIQKALREEVALKNEATSAENKLTGAKTHVEELGQTVAAKKAELEKVKNEASQLAIKENSTVKGGGEINELKVGVTEKRSKEEELRRSLTKNEEDVRRAEKALRDAETKLQSEQKIVEEKKAQSTKGEQAVTEKEREITEMNNNLNALKTKIAQLTQEVAGL